MGYYKIRLKPKARGWRGTWTDDYNTPSKKNPKQTKRYKTLSEAKSQMKKRTWGIPHIKKIVYVKSRRRPRQMGFFGGGGFFR